jgi:integrase
MDVLRPDRAASTRDQEISALRRFYDWLGHSHPGSDFDEILLERDLDRLEEMLTGYLINLKQSYPPSSTTAAKAWKLILGFSTDILRHANAEGDMAKIGAQLQHLNVLYSQLSPSAPRPPQKVRALPAVVVEGLHSALLPNSKENPFSRGNGRWRNFLCFMILLHLGLRVGDLLSLRVDSLQSEFEPQTGTTRFWLNVTDSDEEIDVRARKPRLKNHGARRQLPISHDGEDRFLPFSSSS